jgi:phosphoglucomutase
LAGQPAPRSVLIDVDKLIVVYYAPRPDPTVQAQRVAFGTSGHRGSAFDVSCNEWHVLAITQALCDHRRALGIASPLFMGVDTHALSAPVCASTLEVLSASGVEAMLATNDEPTQIPAISQAILTHNHRQLSGATHAGGFEVSAKSGWYAARPSGTEDLYRIYAESFQGADHLQRILAQAQTTVDAALGTHQVTP